MPISLEQQIYNKNEIIVANKRRLQELEIREASSGISTPPEVLLEMEDIRKKISALENDISALRTVKDFAPSDDILRVLSDEGKYRTVIATCLQTVTEFATLRREFKDLKLVVYISIFVSIGLVIVVLIVIVRVLDIVLK